MKKILMLALTLSTLATAAHAGCPEVQNAIDAKIKAKGVNSFSLDVVAAGDVGTGKIVGNCDGGRNLIVYSRGKASANTNASTKASSAPAAASKPAAAAAKPASPAKPVPALGNY